ncbi:MAG: ABC transporter ATP-binding protein [Chloroflexota bacterium]
MPDTGIPMLRLERVSKTYPGSAQPAVNDLSLDIHEGEIFTLLGPSGCGKSTTLRIVAGRETPDEAAIYFKDRPVVLTSKRLFVPPNKRNVGMVFQSYAIWPHMTVEENVAYPLKLRHVPTQEKRERTSKALEMVGLGGLEKRPAPLLSGGQQQRVALARALVYEPSVLLLDEPFSNLDSKLREQMRLEVKLLQARIGVTVLFVTHDQVEALTLSDRIGVMDGGQLLQVGTPRELYDHPANSFVRDFLGKTLLLRATVRGPGPGAVPDPAQRASAGSGDNSAPAERTEAAMPAEVSAGLEGAPDCVVGGQFFGAEPLTPGTLVWVAVRPEDAELSAGSHAGALHGTIEAALFAGDRTEFQVTIPGQGSVLVYGSRRDRYEAGQQVSLRIRSETASLWPR